MASALSAWDALEAVGVGTDAIVRVVQEATGAALADLGDVGAETAALLSPSIALRFDVVPVCLNGKTLVVATANPRGLNCERDLAFACGYRVAVRIASPSALRAARQRVYGIDPVPTVKSRISWVTTETAVMPLAAPTRGLAVEMLDRLLLDALDQRASDMHFEPADGELLVRFRIDGVLHDIARVPAEITPLLLSRIKIGAGLDIANRLRPQDGRSSLVVDGRDIDLRVSTLPLGERMEKAVIRILDAASTSLDFASLGFTAAEQVQLARILSSNEGMVLVTGPTGSGKTTTLYSALRHMQSRETNIVTVEDPIEYRLEGVNQVQVNERSGLSFAAALRSILRQDPDVVLVGEIRDVDTAAIAIRASMTGHFVLSTLHTNDAPSAIGRLADMGVDMSALSGALKAVIAQRLVRRLCTECRTPQRLQDLPHELHWVFKGHDTTTLYGPVGCPVCRGTGFRGRLAITEMFVIDDEVQQLMGRSTQRLEFLQLARKAGMSSLWTTGLDRVLQGLTSFGELVGVLTPPIPDAGLQQDDVDRLLSDLMGKDSSSRPTDAPRVSGTPPEVPVPPPASIALVRDADLPPAQGPARDGRGVSRLAIAPRADSEVPRVLIVFEHRQQRHSIRAALVAAGISVVEATNGDAALAYACRLRPDAVVTDLALPGLDGIGLLQVLVLERIVEHVFIYADVSDLETLQWAHELGARDVLTAEDSAEALAARVAFEFTQSAVLRAS